CWMPADACQSNARTPQPCNRSGSHLVIEPSVPNARFESAPHSPLAPALVRLQSGTKFPLASDHVRFALVTSAFAGLRDRATEVPTDCTYRPSENLRAVLPLPKRSYAAPSRGEMSL